ncbi:MAG TPA: cell division protein ZipA C-terminal FtsZ-binding domain-containing protein [Novimethylophilus sp.]|jgi:hypothetical protein|uniref:cell division protein ZipA C-terminal FtsZ-binding domain-containing protein n=1 Tax=Novimethylophilus sp. TaxID=2137426 RepID=UPI002F3F27DD
MSQLQIGLVSLGALIILAVLMFNWWQERNIKREMVRRFEGPIDDVLMEELSGEHEAETTEDLMIDDDFRIGSAAAPDEETAIPELVEKEVVIVVESIVEAEFAEAVPEAAPIPQPDVVAAAEVIADGLAPEPVWISNPADADALPIELPPNVDPQIDEIAIITPNRACIGGAIREALLPLPVFQKSVRWLGREVGGKVSVITKEHEQTRFTHIICALQLADRSGPAHGEDLRNFHAKVEDLTARVGGGLEWREHGDPLQYARDLDRFCIDVDVMISLQLTGGGSAPFAGTKLRGVAEAGGLTLQEDGQFHYLNEEGASLFVLVSQDRRSLTADLLRTAQLHGIVLLMDVPRVANGTEAFNLMVMLGRKLETALSARLMDENQQQLGETEIDKIRQQLKVIYSKMLARGITPGSASALRLFS